MSHKRYSISIDTTRYPAIRSYIFGAVKDQGFPAHASELDTKIYTNDDLTKCKDGVYPLIIKMVIFSNECNKYD